jgi:hypothetical protein
VLKDDQPHGQVKVAEVKDLHKVKVVQGQVDLWGVVGQDVVDAPLQVTWRIRVEIEAEHHLVWFLSKDTQVIKSQKKKKKIK